MGDTVFLHRVDTINYITHDFVGLSIYIFGTLLFRLGRSDGIRIFVMCRIIGSLL